MKIKYTIMYSLVGAVVGAVVSIIIFILGLSAALVSCFFTCGSNDENIITENSFPILIICASLGLIIGFIIGIKTDKEEVELKKQSEIEKQQKVLDDIFNKWYGELDVALNRIEVEVTDNDYNYPDIPEKNIYDNIWTLLDKKNDEQPERYTEAFDRRFAEHLGVMRAIIRNSLTTKTGSRHARRAYNSIVHMYFVQCKYNIVDKIDVKAAKEAFSTFYNFTLHDDETYFLKMNGYGNCVLPLADTKDFASYQNVVQNNISEIDKKNNILMNLKSLKLYPFYTAIAENVDISLISEPCKAMWFYAIQKPFDVDKFEHARTLFNKYTMWDSEHDNNLNSVPVESILAAIYAKKNVGGKDAIKQEEKYIFDWLNYSIKGNFKEKCFILASGLAWMELFEYEKKVLLKLVDAQVQLTPELQERLEFLNKGISQNVKVYSVNSGNEFMFDSSSVDWNNNDFDVFFRNAEMKKIQLNYSLAISKWTKTLPLASGQKVLQDKLYAKFMTMIDDFDGEVTCRKVNARAVNLENLEYENAVEFHFNSKRSRCISVLFSCEKYGRNLNITIFTMFTPEEKYNNDELKKYALAIKENIYMESFRESILQSVDSVLKEDKKIYDDDDNNTTNNDGNGSGNKKMFE